MSVEYRFYPNGDPATESWQVSEAGSSTFLLPPRDDEDAFYSQLVADNSEELRIRIEFDVYRFDVTNYTAAVHWLREQCSAKWSGSEQVEWPGWERPEWA